MGKHVTHDEAWDALCNPAAPVRDALMLFVKAHRRSNEVTKGFVLHFAGLIREERIRKEPLAPPLHAEKESKG